MKNLRPQSKLRRKPLEGTLVRGLLLTALVLMGLMFFSEYARGIFHTAALPLWRVGSYVSASVSEGVEFFRSKEELIAENERLRAELQDFSIKLLDRNELYEENIQLKENFGRDASINATLAVVLARPPRAPYDTLVLDSGRAEGVAVGDLVAASETFIIGVIEQVTAETSIARLFSAPGVATEVLLGNRGPSVQAIGKGGGNFEARIPIGTEVVIGQRVFLPVITPHVFAIVEHVAFDPRDSSRTVLFRSPVNPFELRYVTILRHVTP